MNDQKTSSSMLLLNAAVQAARRCPARPASLNALLPVSGVLATAVRLFRVRQATETRPEAGNGPARTQQPYSKEPADAQTAAAAPPVRRWAGFPWGERRCVMRIQLMRSLRGMQGSLDDLIYKRFEGRTIAVPKPDPFTGPPTAAQIAQRNVFKEAASYARSVYQDQVRKAVYVAAAKAAGRQTVFALIMGDRLSPPQVTAIDLTGYAGAIGNLIHVSAVDDFEVVSVHVTLRDAAGDAFEDGPATKGDILRVPTHSGSSRARGRGTREMICAHASVIAVQCPGACYHAINRGDFRPGGVRHFRCGGGLRTDTGEDRAALAMVGPRRCRVIESFPPGRRDAAWPSSRGGLKVERRAGSDRRWR